MALEKTSRYLGNLSVFSVLGIKPFSPVFLSYSLFIISLIVRFLAHISKVFYINIPTKAVENGQNMPFWYAQNFNYQEIYILLLVLIISSTFYFYLKIRQRSQLSFVLGIVSVWVCSILFNLFHLLHLNFVMGQPIIGLLNNIFFNNFNLIALAVTAVFLLNFHKFDQPNRQLSAVNKYKLTILSCILFSIGIICNLVTFTFGTIVNRSSFWPTKWYHQAKLDMPYRVYKPTYITKNHYPSRFQNITANYECSFQYLNPKNKSTIDIRQNGVDSAYDISEVFAARYKNKDVDSREIDFPISKNNKAYLVTANLTNTKTLSFISTVDVQINITSMVPTGTPQLSDEELLKIAQSLK